MTRGGSNRLPPNVHQLRGNVRPSRHGGRRIGPALPPPTCPRWLDPVAKAEWRRITPELVGLGVVTVLDRACLAAYCVSFAGWRRASEGLECAGLVVVGHRKALRKNPLLMVERQYRESMQRFAGELGMTPASRARLHLPDPPEPDPMGDFLSRGGPSA